MSQVLIPAEYEQTNMAIEERAQNADFISISAFDNPNEMEMREGQGEAIYEIGVEDGGTLVGLTDTELKASILTLRKMASAINATVAIVSLGQTTFTTRAFAIRRKFSLFIVLGVSITVILVQI